MSSKKPRTPLELASVAAEKPVDESLCTNCGKCCYTKIIIGRTVYLTPFPCEFLDTETNLCTVYENRYEKNPECQSVPEGMKNSSFPEDCPYVPEHAPPGYRPMREDYDWTPEWKDLDDLAEDLDASAKTLEIVRARGPKARPMHEEAFERIQQARNAQAKNAPSLADRVRAVIKKHGKTKP